MVENILNIKNVEKFQWVCFYLDFVHPDDVEKVREQLNLQPQDGSPNSGGSGRVLDLKTGTVKKDGHASGARLGKFLYR